MLPFFLDDFSFDVAHEDQMRERVLKTYHQLIDDTEKQNKRIQLNLASLRKKIADIKERHAEGKVEPEVYQEFKLKYEEEISKILKDYNEEGFEKSNIENLIKHAIKISRNIGQMLVSADYGNKQGLQSLMFPDGIRYNTDDEHYRTLKMNYTFLEIWHRIRVPEWNKAEKSNVKLDSSPLMAPRRIEPSI